MPMNTLSQDAVRGLMIAAQGLQQGPSSPVTNADVRQMIRQMHVLQIDTIQVVARSPVWCEKSVHRNFPTHVVHSLTINPKGLRNG